MNAIQSSYPFKVVTIRELDASLIDSFLSRIFDNIIIN